MEFPVMIWANEVGIAWMPSEGEFDNIFFSGRIKVLQIER